MKYFKNGVSYSLRDIKKINNNVSFSNPEQLGYIKIVYDEQPNCGELEMVKESFIEEVNGIPYQRWKVVDMFTDYTNEDGVVVTKSEQEQAYLAKKLEETKKDLERTIQSHINAKCVELGYDNENSIAKYLVQGNPFYDECSAISLWIGNVWATSITIMNDVVAGTRTMPTSDEVIAELPTL